MQTVSIPTCYFPSTTLFLDDNRDFLLNFVLQLDESVAYRTFDDPIRALQYINGKQCEFAHQYSLKNYLSASNDKANNARNNLDLAAIHAEVYNPNRFAEVSVVVVDYAMPSIDGLEFCRQIENSSVKKILLTGQADEKLAIKAFNEGLIHRYIKKSEENAAELITKSIFDLQLQYFQLMSDAIERLLMLQRPGCLQDKNFISFFHQFIKNNNIVEYYLADRSGSFFMLDEDANVSLFIVKSEEEMRGCYEQAKAQGVSEEILGQIDSRQKIPSIWKPTAVNTNGLHWIDSLVPAKRFAENDAFYYAHLHGDDINAIRQSKILSYQRYLEELDAEELFIS